MDRRAFFVLALLGLAGNLLGCGPGDGDSSASGVSAGRTLEVEAEPRLSVGVLGGDPMQELDRVVTPFLLPNGNLVVPTRGASAVRVFSPEGSFVKSLGSSGEGPGEFREVREAWARGDTVEVWDSRLLRITRFFPDGEIAVVRLSGGAVNLDAGIGPVGAGWALVSIWFGDPRDDMAGQIFSRDGAHRGATDNLRGMARFSTPTLSGPHPVTQTAIFTTHADEIFAGESDIPVIQVFDSLGSKLREIPLPFQQQASPEAVFRQVVDSAVARAEDDRKEYTRQWVSSYPEPDQLPLFWSMIVDQEGLIWIRPYDPFRHSLVLGGRPGGQPGPGGEWLVLSQQGEEVDRVAMPPELEPVQITSDAVVGLHRDELGVESVRVHRLKRN